MLPDPILQEIQQELLNWHEQGMSILEIGARTSAYKQLMIQLEADVREVLTIPDDYAVLFLGGPARLQFAMIPENLLSQNDQKAGYLLSGIWSEMAFAEACKLNAQSAYCLAKSDTPNGYFATPTKADWQWQPNTAYVYYTPNETINGVRYHEVPQTGGIPLVADMTSCLFSEPINIQDYGVIFAGAQKNIAAAGLTLVIIRHDLLQQKPKHTIPTILDYRTHVEHKSLYATPPTFMCDLAAKMLRWIKAQGGVDALYQRNRAKAEKLYAYIDASSFYQCRVEKNARSLMNICFSLPSPELEEQFLQQAQAQHLLALRGHRLVGGIRASLYNAMPMAGVEALLAFMQQFVKELAE